MTKRNYGFAVMYKKAGDKRSKRVLCGDSLDNMQAWMEYYKSLGYEVKLGNWVDRK